MCDLVEPIGSFCWKKFEIQFHMSCNLGLSAGNGCSMESMGCVSED